MRGYWITLLALCPAAAAQPVFFDDFEGSALLPHWNQPTPSFWEHNVSSSMLNVTGLFFPSSPKSPGNFAVMTATYAPSQSDFRMDVWMGWETGTSPHQLDVGVLGPGGAPIIAQFGYRHSIGLSPEIIAAVTTGFVATPAPPPGIHQFTIARVSTQFEFYLDGTHFASLPDTFGTPAGGVRFFFAGPYPGALGAFHIDRVLVVPAPGSLVLAVALVPFCAGRRRREATAM